MCVSVCHKFERLYTVTLSPFHSSHTHVVADRGMSWQEALDLSQQYPNRPSGFYRSKREQYNNYLYLLALQKENSSHLFNIIRSHTSHMTITYMIT